MTNDEFLLLLKMEKSFESDHVSLPNSGESSIFELVGEIEKNKFYLDIDRRGKIELSRFKIQNRYALTNFHWSE